MGSFPQTLVAHAFCPACARAVQEGGRQVVYQQGVLCGYHRGRFAALLRDSSASQQAVCFWLQFLKAKGESSGSDNLQSQ